MSVCPNNGRLHILLAHLKKMLFIQSNSLSYRMCVPIQSKDLTQMNESLVNWMDIASYSECSSVGESYF